MLYLFNEKYDKSKIYKIIESFARHKKFQQRINFVKISKVLINNNNIFNEKIKELFLIIALNDKNMNVKIALCKLIKKILINNKNELNKDASIYHLYKILFNKEKSISIKTIFKDVIIEDKKEDENLNEYYNKYEYNKNIFIGDNSYFVKEFNIDIEDEKLVNINNEKDEKNFDNNINNEIKIDNSN